MQCTICLSDEGEVVQKNCHCRGDNGAVHVDCLVDLASHAAETREDWDAWEKCGTCGALFRGHAAFKLAETWFARTDGLGSDDVIRASALMALAREKSWQAGDSEATEAMYREVWEVRTRVLGAEHSNTLWSALCLAESHRNRGKYVEGFALQVETVAAMERAADPNIYCLLRARRSLGEWYRIMGERHTSLKILRDVFEKYEEHFSTDDPGTLDALHDLAIATRDAGELEESIALSTDLLARRKRVQGAWHPSTLCSMTSLSILLYKQEKFGEAEAVAREDVSLREEHGSDPAGTAVSRHNLALYILLSGRPSEAEPILRDVLSLPPQTFEPNVLLFVKATHGLALSTLKRHDEAIPLLRATLQDQRDTEMHGSEHPLTLRTASILGEALVAQGSAGEGAALLRDTLATQIRVVGEADFDTRQTLAWVKKLETSEATACAER
eukprot:m.189873 g.189873  ORF g.189873 m.189873 type:complete len:443 (+) comp15118_c2_seq3:45-1373(+)